MKTGFRAVFKNEWRLLWYSPKRIFFVLILPLLLFGMLADLFEEAVPRNLPVAYLDNDQTPKSRQLLRFIEATPEIELTKGMQDLRQAKELMQRGEIYGFIVIPDQFQKKLYKGEPQKVVCYTNNQFIMPASLLQKAFLTTVGTFAAGVNLNKREQSGEMVHQAMSNIQPLMIDEHVLYNPYINYSYYLLPALFPMMFHMVVMIVTVYVVGIAFKYRKGEEWYLLSGKNPFKALFGKLSPYTLCFIFMSWLMNFILFGVLGVPLKTSIFDVTLITILMVIIYQVLAVFVVSVCNELRAAMTYGGGFAAIAFSFAAYTFPMEGLPKSLQFLAGIFPFTHYLKYYINVGIRGVPIQMTFIPLLSLLLFAIFIFFAYLKFVKLLKSGGYEQVY